MVPPTFRFFFLLFIVIASCEDADTPLSADARYQIDSISTAQIRQLRVSMDSLCAVETQRALPMLFDSIKKERQREIEELTGRKNK